MNTHIVTQVDIAIIAMEGGMPCLKLFAKEGENWKMTTFVKRSSASGWWCSVNEISYPETDRHTTDYVVTFVPEVIRDIFKGVQVPYQGRSDFEIESRLSRLRDLSPGADYSGRFPANWS